MRYRRNPIPYYYFSQLFLQLMMKCLKGQRMKDYFLLENGDKMSLVGLQNVKENVCVYVLVDDDVIVKIFYPKRQQEVVKILSGTWNIKCTEMHYMIAQNAQFVVEHLKITQKWSKNRPKTKIKIFCPNFGANQHTN